MTVAVDLARSARRGCGPATAEGPVVVATAYRFVALHDLAALKASLGRLACRSGVRGTILLAPEGLNATIAGPPAAVDAVLDGLMADPRFADLPVSRASATAIPFGRLEVKIRREIITFGAADVSPAAGSGRRVAPADWNAILADPDVRLIDTRNTYEIAIGSFPGAIDPGTASFRAFKAFVDDRLDPAVDRRIAMFCTGGIRCEKASAYLLARGFADVAQLDGGILAYLRDIPAADSRWQGECYVFDGRVAVVTGLAEGRTGLCRACGGTVAAGGTCGCGRAHPATPASTD